MFIHKSTIFKKLQHKLKRVFFLKNLGTCVIVRAICIPLRQSKETNEMLYYWIAWKQKFEIVEDFCSIEKEVIYFSQEISYYTISTISHIKNFHQNPSFIFCRKFRPLPHLYISHQVLSPSFLQPNSLFSKPHYCCSHLPLSLTFFFSLLLIFFTLFFLPTNLLLLSASTFSRVISLFVSSSSFQ